MTSLLKEKVAAVVPALNEQATVGEVLKVLLSSKFIDEIILVDDGSVDKTAQIGEKLEVKVVKLSQIGGSGKGNAMKKGVESTNAEIIVFFDADLVGLSQDHISSLIEPMLKEEIKMCVGIRDRYLNLPGVIAKADPLSAISGERAVRKELFDKIPNKFLQGFAVETALNYYCLSKKIPTKRIVLKDLKIITKERKWGFIKGFLSRLKMMWQIVKIRIIILFNKNEFI